jgi:hypothetical protein
MLNKLKMLSGMSGMQKNILNEGANELRHAEQEVDTLTKELANEKIEPKMKEAISARLAVAQRKLDSEKAKASTSGVIDKAELGTLGGEKGKIPTSGKIAYDLLRHGTATGQLSADKAAVDRLAVADLKISKLEGELENPSLSEKERSELLAQLDNAKREKESVILYNQEE